MLRSFNPDTKCFGSFFEMNCKHYRQVIGYVPSIHLEEGITILSFQSALEWNKRKWLVFCGLNCQRQCHSFQYDIVSILTTQFELLRRHLGASLRLHLEARNQDFRINVLALHEFSMFEIKELLDMAGRVHWIGIWWTRMSFYLFIYPHPTFQMSIHLFTKNKKMK